MKPSDCKDLGELMDEFSDDFLEKKPLEGVPTWGPVTPSLQKMLDECKGQDDSAVLSWDTRELPGEVLIRYPAEANDSYYIEIVDLLSDEELSASDE